MVQVSFTSSASIKMEHITSSSIRTVIAPRISWKARHLHSFIPALTRQTHLLSLPKVALSTCMLIKNISPVPLIPRIDQAQLLSSLRTIPMQPRLLLAMPRFGNCSAIARINARSITTQHIQSLYLYPSGLNVGRDLSPPPPIYRPPLINHPNGCKPHIHSLLAC